MSFTVLRMSRDLELDELLSDDDLRLFLGVSRTTLWRLRKHGGLPCGKVGREYRYRKFEVLVWLKENQQRDNQLRLRFDRASGRSLESI